MLSVILPNYNHGHFIKGAILAILKQMSPGDELIVIDDGSSDDSPEIIRTLACTHDALKPIYFSNNKGVHLAVERGLELAQGDLLYFAAADDRICEGFFAASISLLDIHSAAAFCTSRAEYIDTSGRVINEIKVPFPVNDFVAPDKVHVLLVKYGGWFRCNTAIYRRSIFDESGGFDDDLGPFCDGFLCMLMALQYGCCFVPKIAMQVRYDPKSLSMAYKNNLDDTIEFYTGVEQVVMQKYYDQIPQDVWQRWCGRWRYAVLSENLKQINKDIFERVLTALGFKNTVIRKTLSLLYYCRMFTLVRTILILMLSPWDLRQVVSHRTHKFFSSFARD